MYVRETSAAGAGDCALDPSGSSLRRASAPESLLSFDITRIAPAGHYLALRIGFAFPKEEVNRLPPSWVEHYTAHSYAVVDPVIRWAHTHVGATRWSAIAGTDPAGVLCAAREFGLNYGAAVALTDEAAPRQRSFGLFLRADREFTDQEMSLVQAHLLSRHRALLPPGNLTVAEIEALRLVKEGWIMKQIAFELGVSEGAIKQRLRNARAKLDAKTGAELVSRAVAFGII